ncbi:hypothetical protein HZS_4934 [Henneguya salminicola]|nr:hypothetical protein HZS_4934 [Henneguya salminicola]
MVKILVVHHENTFDRVLLIHVLLELSPKFEEHSLIHLDEAYDFDWLRKYQKYHQSLAHPNRNRQFTF